MAITKSKRFFGGTKLTFKCPTCGATMPITPGLPKSGNRVVCKSCQAVHTLSGADVALLDEAAK